MIHHKSPTDTTQVNGTARTTPEYESDPVLAALAATEERYLTARDAAARDAAEAAQLRAEFDDLRASVRQAVDEANRAKAKAEAEHRQYLRQKERADRLTDSLKEIHRAVFGGNVFDLILRACLRITGGTRGLFLAAGPDGTLRPRAVVDVDGYPRKKPSDFIKALAAPVVADGKPVVVNDPPEFAALPAPDGPGEQFNDCLVAPVVLMEAFNGILILADKPDGFDDDDVQTVLSVGDQAGVAVENAKLRDDLLAAHFSVIGVLADAIEAKDPYTRGHCTEVARMARRTAEKLAASDAVLSITCYGGLLHDVGKIGVSDGVLNKPGKLLPEEWELMQSHVRIGRDILARIPALGGVSDVVHHHHERWDGAGYPDGLAADAIPLAARIVCVADAYCAMTSKRSYKESLNPVEAREELLRCKGSHFDPEVVDAFLAALDDADCEPCPDACDLLPQLTHDAEFRHAIRPTTTR